MKFQPGHHQGTCPIPRDRAERADKGGVSIEPAEPASQATPNLMLAPERAPGAQNPWVVQYYLISWLIQGIQFDSILSYMYIYMCVLPIRKFLNLCYDMMIWYDVTFKSVLYSRMVWLNGLAITLFNLYFRKHPCYPCSRYVITIPGLLVGKYQTLIIRCQKASFLPGQSRLEYNFPPPKYSGFSHPFFQVNRKNAAIRIPVRWFLRCSRSTN